MVSHICGSIEVQQLDAGLYSIRSSSVNPMADGVLKPFPANRTLPLLAGAEISAPARLNETTDTPGFGNITIAARTGLSFPTVNFKTMLEVAQFSVRLFMITKSRTTSRNRF